MFKELFTEAKEFRYALNIDGPGKDGRYKSKDFEALAKQIPGFVSLRNGKPGVPGMITVKAKDVHEGWDTVNTFFRDNPDWVVEVTEI